MAGGGHGLGRGSLTAAGGGGRARLSGRRFPPLVPSLFTLLCHRRCLWLRT
ncbi:hypothetical protein BU14_0686s0010 [Porphyra umbilicalis]|uniref:Uncharacterized protein n=1 Tax=Porphyra umbilicalis TaxID=2786 RepID=A0A1X6NQ21_PORUM|nr:hypothetical protein BU14_0686s0010 [Porphyra umbilicalis]|eukprot:OSX70708.1 hypothetical protein BU14_0686s0010 [Porphyra umbilicalis]